MRRIAWWMKLTPSTCFYHSVFSFFDRERIVSSCNGRRQGWWSHAANNVATDDIVNKHLENTTQGENNQRLFDGFDRVTVVLRSMSARCSVSLTSTDETRVNPYGDWTRRIEKRFDWPFGPASFIRCRSHQTNRPVLDWWASVLFSQKRKKKITKRRIRIINF